MRKIVPFLFVLVLILAACAGQPTPASETETLPNTGPEAATSQPATSIPTEMPVEATTAPAQEPDSTSALESTPAGAASGESLTGTVIYTMVPEESSVTYSVGETFLEQGNVFNTAVGTTAGVNGEIQVNFDEPQNSSVGAMTVDISTFVSDSSRRDGAIRDRFIQTAQFPTVTFTPITISGMPDTIEPGVAYPITLSGDLTIREVTLPATFEAQVQLEGDALTGQATTTFLMSDFGFGPISILNMLETEDEVEITVDFVARPS